MMDLGLLGRITLDWNFLSGFLSIILIDLILAGDNAVVIAMAVRSLPGKQRIKGIIFGAGAAVLLRVTLTFFAAQLLAISFIKILGGVAVTWIAVKLFAEGCPEDKCRKEATTFGQAVKIIVIADLVMSTDNVMAVAAASQGDLFLLLFGLGLSIPFVVGTSTFLSMIMDKYPVIVYIGAAILGKVGGELIITDPFVVSVFTPTEFLRYSVEGLFAAGVIVAGKLWMKWQVSRRKYGEELLLLAQPGDVKNGD